MFGPSKRTLYRDLARQRDHYERIIADLQDRLAAAYGRPWMVPPADLVERPAPVVEAPEWTTSPEQFIPIG